MPLDLKCSKKRSTVFFLISGIYHLAIANNLLEMSPKYIIGNKNETDWFGTHEVELLLLYLIRRW